MKTNLMMQNTYHNNLYATKLTEALESLVVLRNLSVKELIDRAIRAKEGRLTSTGALSCETGEHTGRSPKDKFIVEDDTTRGNVDWGNVNQPMTPDHFDRLFEDQLGHIRSQLREVYEVDAFAGADPEFRIPIRVYNESAWANLFAKHLFIRPTGGELAGHHPEFTVLHTPNFLADPARHGTRSKTFIVVNFKNGLILIGGTSYAGEIKKSIFSVLNYLYPLRGILSMHCSANIAKSGPENAVLFFGLSGTGKTTLSADPNRRLIGDDEHGWSDRGIFNFEGGCYAKCINLSREREPQIWNAIRDGAILENVILDTNGVPDYNDTSLTENTRAAYPVEYIDDAVLSGVAGHPKNIIFLTCDAFGIMPPVAKLSRSQTMYHFLSGYTAKVAGTEKGMGSSPEATFSTCFGAPFLPLLPTMYSDMLGKKLEEHSVRCWLVNTGWIGGGYGVGRRIQLEYTRRIVDAILSGELNETATTTDPVFRIEIPRHINGVPSELLDQRKNWSNGSDYEAKSKELAARFSNNFKRFRDHAPEVARHGGPISGA